MTVAELLQEERGRRPAKGDPVIDRVFSLLNAFDPHHRSMTLTELSVRSGIPISSVARMTRRLVAAGALERHQNGRFVIGLRLWELGTLSPRGHVLKRMAKPAMVDLARHTQQHVLLGVREGTEAVLLESISAANAVRLVYEPGARLPLHTTGIGLALFAHAPVEVQDQLFSSMPDIAGGAGPSAAALRVTLSQIRTAGLATVRRPADSTVAVAAPIFGSDEQVAAAVSVVIPSGGADPYHLHTAVRTAARSISRLLASCRSNG